MVCEKERVDALLKHWAECLDEMAGTEYDCSFDCGSHLGEEGYCYHGRAFKEEEERATGILEELLRISKEPNRDLREAEDECRRPGRQGWGLQRGLSIIEKFKR